MTRAYSPKLLAYVGVAGATLVAAMVARSPELAAVGAPFAVVVALGLAWARPVELRARLRLAEERVVEGDEVEATLELVGDLPVELELLLSLPERLAVADGARRVVVRLRRGGRAIPLRLEARAWGAYAIGGAAVRIGDAFGIVAHETVLEPSALLRVYPRLETLRALVPPAQTQPFVGNRVARTRGDGIEFADLRPFVPGDRIRRINWRASAKGGELYVNEAHPERNSDVVLFLDAFADARDESGGAYDEAVRAAASLAHGYLETRDRVGVVGFGSTLRWLGPSLGARQLYRILDTLLASAAAQSLASFRVVDPFVPVATALSRAWTGADSLPPRSLPPHALVVALTPLLDERSARTLLDVQARGFDLAIVEISPLRYARRPRRRLDELALRLWPLRRDVLRWHFERLGIPVAQWTEGEPLTVAVEEVNAFRRSAHRVSA